MIWFLALSIAIAVPVSQIGEAQPTVRTAEDTVKIEAGLAQTLPISISVEKGEYKASVSLPSKKWKASLFERRFEVQKENRTEILRISVPQMVSAGTYPVVYRVEGEDGRTETKVFVKVPLRRDVNFELSDVPKVALKGDSVVANVSAENNSNTEETVFVDGEKEILNPGEKKTVQVTRFAETVGSESFSFSARREGKNAKQFVRNYKVVSPNDQPNLKWKKYSSEIEVRANQLGGGQLFARGQERIEDSRLNFNIESPQLGSQNRFFRYRSGRYSASFINPESYQIRFGDRSFEISRLIGSASGFGAGGRYKAFKKHSVGAYYFGSRRGRNRNEFGFDIKRDLSKKYQASVNVGRKNRFGFSGTSVSSGIFGSPTNLLEFEAESSLDFASSGQDFSYFGRTRLGNGSHFLSAEYESFSQSSVSFQRGSRSFSLRGETEAVGTRLFSSYRNRISSLGNKRTYFQIGVSRRRFGFSYKRRNGPIGKKDGIQGNISLSGDRFSFYSGGRVEWLGNGNQRKWFSSRVGYRTGRFSASIRGRYRESFQKSFGLSASASYKWKNGFRLKAHSSAQKRFDSFRRVVQGHRLELSYKLRSQAQITARGFYRSRFWGSVIEVSIPLSVPVKKDQSVGLITGRVIDENRDAISGAIVLVGNKAAVTGEDGRYSVRQGPGEYSIQIAPRSAEPNQIVKGVGRLVRALGGKKTRRTIRIVGGGTIKVKFENGEPGIEVKATGENESYQKKTGKGGAVKFFGLLPGKWTIRSENKKKKVKLGAGDSVSVELEKEEDIEFFNEQ